MTDLIDLGDPPGLAEFIARPIREDPATAVHRIADTLAAYWELAFQEHWPRILALLEADVLWRSRRLATGQGPQGVRQLCQMPRVSRRADVLNVTGWV